MGSLLVTLQFGLLLLLAWMASPRVADGSISAIAIVLALASIALVVWTFRHNRPGNFNIRPTPRQGGQLITSGPYRHVRHPMYSAVLLGAAAMAWISPPLAAWLAWGALLAVLLGKAAIEERWMMDAHPQYAPYRQHSWRLVPGLY